MHMITGKRQVRTAGLALILCGIGKFDMKNGYLWPENCMNVTWNLKFYDIEMTNKNYIKYL